VGTSNRGRYPPFWDDNPSGIYEKILNGRIFFPTHFKTDAKDIIRKLLTADCGRRLGNLNGGTLDVKNHAWFKGVDWEELFHRRITPPIIPRFTHPGDTGNFEKYSEEIPEFGSGTKDDPYKDLFKDF